MRLLSKRSEQDLDEVESAVTTDVSENIIYISGPIMAETVDDAIAFIIHHNIVRKHDRLIVFINSPGGDLHHGFALCAAIEASQIPVITVSLGECDSAGLIVAMSGQVRLIAPNTSILSHMYSAGWGVTKHVDIIARQKDINMTSEKIINHYVNHTGLSRKEVTKHLLNDRDVYLSTQEAITYNLFDAEFISFDQLSYGFDVDDDEPLETD